MMRMANQHRLRPIRVLDATAGVEYDEETFRYFLSIEQARATRANQPLRLLLASLDGSGGQAAQFPRPASSRLFAAMRQALRDTDVVGWYQQDRIAAAVLTALPAAGEHKIASLEKRITDDLKRRLPSSVAGRVRLRVVQREFAERGTA